MAAKLGGSGRFLVILVAIAAAGGFALWRNMQRSTAGTPLDVTALPADTAAFRGYVLGSPDAPVEIVEYADYMCGHCASFSVVQFPDVRQRLVDAGRVRWVFRDYPLQGNPHSRTAAHAAACAADQGRYWEMQDAIFAGQTRWARPGNPTRAFEGMAESLGLDVAAWDDCMDSQRHASRIEASYQEGNRLGVNSTPTFLIGGKLYPGNQPYDRIRALVDSIAPVAAAPTVPAPASP
jgi:protein-disulfide isomerase